VKVKHGKQKPAGMQELIPNEAEWGVWVFTGEGWLELNSGHRTWQSADYRVIGLVIDAQLWSFGGRQLRH